MGRLIYMSPCVFTFVVETADELIDTLKDQKLPIRGFWAT